MWLLLLQNFIEENLFSHLQWSNPVPTDPTRRKCIKDGKGEEEQEQQNFPNGKKKSIVQPRNDELKARSNYELFEIDIRNDSNENHRQCLRKSRKSSKVVERT